MLTLIRPSLERQNDSKWKYKLACSKKIIRQWVLPTLPKIFHYENRLHTIPLLYNSHTPISRTTPLPSAGRPRRGPAIKINRANDDVFSKGSSSPSSVRPPNLNMRAETRERSPFDLAGPPAHAARRKSTGAAAHVDGACWRRILRCRVRCWTVGTWEFRVLVCGTSWVGRGNEGENEEDAPKDWTFVGLQLVRMLLHEQP